jgi:hypothetical protein
MPVTYTPQAKSRATSIGGSPIDAAAAVECLSIREVLKFAAENSLDVDHLIRLDNSVALPAVPFNIVVDGTTYSAKAAVRGCGRMLSQLLAKKT